MLSTIASAWSQSNNELNPATLADLSGGIGPGFPERRIWTALAQVRDGDLSGQSLPDPLWRRGESLKTMHDHSAQ